MPVFNGTSGDDAALNGSTDHDLINGLQGNDTINADAGDDLIRPGTGDDSVDGGTGWNRVSYYGALGDTLSGGVTVSLLLQGSLQNTGGGGIDTLTNIHHLTGSIHDDTLIGDGGDNWLWGGFDPDANGGLGGAGGNETISAGGGNDLVEVGTGNHTLDGGTGTDSLSFFSAGVGTAGAISFSLALQGAAQATGQGNVTASGFENLSGSVHNDTLAGDGGDNVIAGDQGNDLLSGGAGSDILYGDGRITVDTHGTGYSGPITTYADVDAAFGVGTGNDTLDGGAGDDTLNGGGGTDTASFASWTERVVASLGNSGNGVAVNSDLTEQDQLISIENLSGTAFNDSLNGNNLANVLTGGDGHDLLFGRGGDDVMVGGNGDDFLRGSDGADVMDGGAGWDRVSSFVISPTAGVTFDLNIQGVAQDTGQGLDTLIGIEHASGTTLNDTLIGNSGDNWLWDGSDPTTPTIASGNDTITAGAGNDLVEVGAGDDVLDGGTGTDTWSLLGGHYEISPAGVTVSLALQGAAQNTEQGMMTATGFENLSGSLYDDNLTGDNADNILLGDLGSDSLSGGAGDDTLYGDGRIHVDAHETGGSGPITLVGNVDDLDLDGDLTNEFVSGNDVLNGGRGSDTLYGGRGDDVLTGGQHDDTFVIESLSGDDRITDFGPGDMIVMDGIAGVDDFSDLTIVQVGRDTMVTWGTADSLLLEDVRARSIDASDFDFTGASAALAIEQPAYDGRGGSDYLI